jgi:peptide methionine sulfoxide reductase msrA/msrB
MKNKLIIVLTLVIIISSCTNTLESKNSPLKDAKELVVLANDTDTLWEAKTEQPNSYWEKQLTAQQYDILRKKGTERPFTHPYNDNKKEGIYQCAACANPLYHSTTKFKSGTGWPSFWQPFFTKSIRVGADSTHGMSRDEVVCGRCDGHLGHVFNDGPAPTGLRYCINGGALDFIEQQKLATAVFAQGCFWCVEEIFEAVKGVKGVVSGYAGGTEVDPTYQQVGAGKTSHAEAVKITYDPTIITYQELLKVYFNSGDITQVDGQGNDKGAQYRSILFYHSTAEKKQIEVYIHQLKESGEYQNDIAVEVVSFNVFYNAEEYHQDYVKLNPTQSYVKAVSIPRYEQAIKKFPELLKQLK